MKTIVLAAGYATRLYPLTENFPKPLLEIGHNTILGRLLDDVDGIPEVDGHVIVTNGKFAPMFEKWSEEREATVSGATLSSDRKPITVLSDGTFTNVTRLGAVCDLLLAMDKLKIDDDLLVLAADNILDFSLRGFVEEFHRKGTSMIMCHHEPEVYKLQRTGVIEVDDDFRVLQMQEKPQEPVSHWAVPPFYIYRREDLDLVRGAIAGGCGTDAPGSLARYMAGKTVLHAWPMPAGRFDIGSLDTYEQAKLKYK
ncbi:MAG: nucleotidyltransferase family protein [Bacteroidales bacterium]|nr:nucleotidyltransferase family protein [Bacteroidales bacterium]